jgi:hypothetical protein
MQFGAAKLHAWTPAAIHGGASMAVPKNAWRAGAAAERREAICAPLYS